MKNFAVVLFLLIAASMVNVASAAQVEVYGQISIQGDEIVLESYDGKQINISASNVRINSAQEGLFRLRPNTIPVDTFTLVEVVNNNGALKINHHNGLNIRRDEIVCAEIYQPVCGRLPKTTCAPGMLCAQVMPFPQTFGNLCELKAAGATLIHKGECSESDDLGSLPARPMPKRHPGMLRN